MAEKITPKKSSTVKVTVIVAAALVLIVGSYYLAKEIVIGKIMTKYKNEPNFDAAPEGLRKLNLKTLLGILDGSIR